MPEYPWGDLALNLGASALAVAILIGIIMVTSIRRRNHSLIDIFWGPGFGLVAVVSFVLSASSPGDDLRRLVVLLATLAWSLRLGLHLARRNLGQGEDPRYTALMRRRTGSLVGYLIRKVYGLQGVLMWVVSIPVQIAMYESASLDVLGLLGLGLWLFGFGFEAIGDWQLTRFKADPANAGTILDTGLWAWTRHPNYFGDSCVWFGLWLLALGHPIGLLAVISPLVMTRLLVSYTGKELLEKGMLRRRGAAYADYVARTSGFLPRRPRRQSPTSGGTRG